MICTKSELKAIAAAYHYHSIDSRSNPGSSCGLKTFMVDYAYALFVYPRSMRFTNKIGKSQDVSFSLVLVRYSLALYVERYFYPTVRYFKRLSMRINLFFVVSPLPFGFPGCYLTNVPSHFFLVYVLPLCSETVLSGLMLNKAWDVYHDDTSPEVLREILKDR